MSYIFTIEKEELSSFEEAIGITTNIIFSPTRVTGSCEADDRPAATYSEDGWGLLRIWDYGL